MQRLIMLVLGAILCASTAHAYDITATFEHDGYEFAASYKIYYGPTKGGPYPTAIDCGKPILKADKTMDCPGSGLTLRPIYAVAVAIDVQGAESPKSPEYFFAAPVGAPVLKGIVRKTATGN
jgi:hypothetical protein